MRSGIVPKFYKTGYISPLFKKGSRCEAGNYRPVTLTSHIVKVFERVVRKHMVNYLEDNSLLTNKQHGFRSGRSCLTQMLDHFDDIYEGFTRGEDTDSIYLDYAKAFDKVDLNLLVRKLRRYGFHNKLIDWIKSFLSDREQVVVLNGIHSDIAKVLSGVPQGSVLGPLLFILFINDLEQVVLSSKVSFFADDTRVSKRIGCHDDCLMLQEDLYRILEWSRNNNMKLHEQKFELLNHLHNSKNSCAELPFYSTTLQYKVSSEDVLYPVEEVRDLGVTVSNDLKWSKHIGNMVSKARRCRNGAVAIIPPLSKSSSLKNQTLYDMSFAVQGPKLWNKVPQSIKVAETFDTFKHSLSDFLALIPDTPPVAGYSCSWSNSLIDYSPSRWSDI
ncbi:hypothetical protein ACHWQZ_G000973 [Mnemiopsis leidyi]